MGLFYTKKKENEDEKTVPTQDFMERLAKARHNTEENIELPRTEQLK